MSLTCWTLSATAAMRGRIVAGLVLLAIGLTWALGYSGIAIFPGGFATWWPSILILVGAVKLLVPPARIFGGILLMGAGAILQLWRLGLVPGLPWIYAGPLALVLLGAAILASAFRHRRYHWREA